MMVYQSKAQAGMPKNAKKGLSPSPGVERVDGKPAAAHSISITAAPLKKHIGTFELLATTNESDCATDQSTQRRSNHEANR